MISQATISLTLSEKMMCYEPCYRGSKCEPGSTFNFTFCLFSPLQPINLCPSLKCNANITKIDTATLNEIYTFSKEEWGQWNTYPLFLFLSDNEFERSDHIFTLL